MPQVYNRRDPNIPAGAVYVGRPTKWGNPYPMRWESMRVTVVEAYRGLLAIRPDLVADARRELRGKDLVCWCAPLSCHADVLLEIANADGDGDAAGDADGD